MRYTSIYINDDLNKETQQNFINVIKNFRQKEYKKLIEYETKNNRYYLPIGIKYADWKEFRETCTEEELKRWFGVE